MTKPINRPIRRVKPGPQGYPKGTFAPFKNTHVLSFIPRVEFTASNSSEKYIKVIVTFFLEGYNDVEPLSKLKTVNLNGKELFVVSKADLSTDPNRFPGALVFTSKPASGEELLIHEELLLPKSEWKKHEIFSIVVEKGPKIKILDEECDIIIPPVP